jgi:hypothetical protein
MLDQPGWDEGKRLSLKYEASMTVDALMQKSALRAHNAR